VSLAVSQSEEAKLLAGLLGFAILAVSSFVGLMDWLRAMPQHHLKEALARGKLKEFTKEHEIKPRDRHPQAKERFGSRMDATATGMPKAPVGKNK
jgi:hypothetical protein